MPINSSIVHTILFKPPVSFDNVQRIEYSNHKSQRENFIVPKLQIIFFGCGLRNSGSSTHGKTLIDLGIRGTKRPSFCIRRKSISYCPSISLNSAKRLLDIPPNGNVSIINNNFFILLQVVDLYVTQLQVSNTQKIAYSHSK